MWYVVQVLSGREDAAIGAIKRHVHPALIKEVFTPRYRAMRKRNGEWEPADELLTPGYVIVDTDNPEALEAQLREVSAFTRLLGSEERFLPLDREECAWLEAWTRRSDRVIGPSLARIEKGRVKILSGPLFGREADLVKVHMRKREAIVKMRVMGREKEIKLALEIVGKETS